MPKALAAATRQLKAALQDKIDTRNLRRQHQNTVIQGYEAKGNSKLAKKIRSMQRTEETQRVFKKCQQARHKKEEGGLSHLLIPTNPEENPRTCTDWMRIDCLTKIQDLLQARNKDHFGQSK